MGIRVLDRSFSAGEITPELFSRVDLDKRGEALALCRNFITLPHGPAINRTGTQLVQAVKNATVATRLIPFSYNNVQTFAIQVGAGYFRWHTQGSTLSYTTPAAYNGATAYAKGDMAASGGVNYYCIAATTGNAPPNASYWYAMPTNPNIYEVPNSYAAADLMNIHYVQSADVLTLVHPNYPVTELRRYGATNWQLANPSFNPPANVLTSLTATPTLAGAITYSYVVTTVATTNTEESVASTPFTCTNDLTIAGHTNAITFTDPSAAGTNIRYNVYKLSNGLYGYIGQCGSAGLTDNNITPNIALTPPISDTVFASAGNYPGAVGYFQQRRAFAGTTNQPQNLWLTVSGTESNMSYAIPVQSNNRIAMRIAAREASAIYHIVPAASLLLLTPTCEWTVSAAGGVLTPSSINVTPQSYVGANQVPPVVVNNIVLYAASRGGHVRELAYSWQASSYVSADLSLMAPHLFDYYTILDMAYSRGPVPILWAVSSTGSLLGMTYMPEQKVAAWHHHDTLNGTFESVCTITENNEDMLYTIVNRTINGSTQRFVERLHTRNFTTLSDAFFVDCGATFYNSGTFTRAGTLMSCTMVAHGLTNGAAYAFQFSDTSFGTLPAGTTYTVTVTGTDTFTIVVPNSGATTGTITQLVTTVSGITWLANQTVNILTDGAVVSARAVSAAGVLTLDQPASKVTFGLPITAQVQTPPAVGQQDSGFLTGRQKNVNKVYLRVNRSSGILAGPDFDHLVPYKQRTTEPYGSPPNLITDEVEIILNPSWAANGQVCVQQTDPLPLNLASMTLEFAVGG